MPRVLTRLTLVCLLAIALASPAPAPPPTAHAGSHQTMSFEAPRELVDASQREEAFTKIQSLGASSLRVILYWQGGGASPKSPKPPGFTATDPPQYDWSRYDPILTGAARRGWSVIL